MHIEMYGESRFMHFWVDILTVLYIFGFGTARLGERRLNHIHSINGAEVINASVSDSIGYRWGSLRLAPIRIRVATCTSVCSISQRRSLPGWKRI